MIGTITISTHPGSEVILANMAKSNPINVDAILLEMHQTQALVQHEIDLEQSDNEVLDEAIPELREALEEYINT